MNAFKRRIGCTSQAFGDVKRIWRIRDYKEKIKTRKR